MVTSDAKVKFVGIDIFTGKKYQELQASTHNMDEVIVRREEYDLLGISKQGDVSAVSDGELVEFVVCLW